MAAGNILAGRSARLVMLLGSTSLAGLLITVPLALAQDVRSSGAPAAAASPLQRSIAFNISPQPLASGIVAFSRAAGINLVFDGAVPSGARTPGVSGTLSVREAVNRLLAGTGLSARFAGNRTVQIFDPSKPVVTNSAAPEGAIQLDTVDVSGGRVEGFTTDTPYLTPGAVSHISEETIDRFRGSSPADIFRGTPGVLSGEARNGGGGIDVNIRGMQGMGRVATTIDGA